MSRLYEIIKNQKNDFLHKLSTRLIRENQSICLENLNVQGMLQNSKLARSISSVSWSKFVEILRYKGKWHGINMLKIGRFEPSSKMCNCGYINCNLQLKDRSWICDKCKKLHDRDVLAANNIKNFAFDKQSLTQNRVGHTRINAQGEDKLQSITDSDLR